MQVAHLAGAWVETAEMAELSFMLPMDGTCNTVWNVYNGNTINKQEVSQMKTKLALLSLILLAACGGGSDSSAAPVSKTDQATQQEQAPAQQPEQPQQKEEEKVEEKKDPSIDYFEYLDPYSDTYKPPYEVPSWDHEPRRDGDTYPSLSLQKFINLGIVRIINENKMVEGALAADLKAEMADMTFDKAMQHYVGQCQGEKDRTYVAPAEDEIYNATCVGIGYAYWALVHGTEGTKGNPYQCVNKGHCGYIFDWYK